MKNRKSLAKLFWVVGLIASFWCAGSAAGSTYRPFTSVSNVDLPGNDLGGPIPIPSGFWGDCENECFYNSQCKAYTFVPTGVQGNQAQCWLKGGITKVLSSPQGMISGMPKPISPDLSVEWFADRPGYEYRTIPALTLNLCIQACQRDEFCLAYTYVQPGLQGPQSNCYLKGGASGKVTGLEGLVSGLRQSLNSVPGLSVEPSIDYIAGNYSSFNVVNYMDCARSCKNDGQCRAYTYVPAGLQGDRPVCYLKNDLSNGTAVGDPGLVSGRK